MFICFFFFLVGRWCSPSLLNNFCHLTIIFIKISSKNLFSFVVVFPINNPRDAVFSLLFWTMKLDFFPPSCHWNWSHQSHHQLFLEIRSQIYVLIILELCTVLGTDNFILKQNYLFGVKHQILILLLTIPRSLLSPPGFLPSFSPLNSMFSEHCLHSNFFPLALPYPRRHSDSLFKIQSRILISQDLFLI